MDVMLAALAGRGMYALQFIIEFLVTKPTFPEKSSVLVRAPAAHHARNQESRYDQYS
jgi:hypothetical protein